MKKSKSLFGRLNNSVNLCESVSNFSLCLRAFVAETQLVRRSLGEGGSIKIERLCETNPIFKTPKMNLNPCLTMDYENKPPLQTPEKQTQSNPISEKPPAEI
jgi:hypothetical protein